MVISMDIRSIFVTLFVFSIVQFVGCADVPEVSSATYGRIVKEVPALDEAGKPFDFPYSDPGEHDNCEFKDDDMF